MENKYNIFDSNVFDNQYMERNINNFNSKEEAFDYYFNYYKEHGYPNYKLENYNVVEELNNLIDFNEESIYNGENNSLTQTMHSCGFLWCFFPNWIHTRTYNDSSLYENWNNDEKLKTLIHKTVDYNLKHNDGIWTENRIRQNAKVYCSKQTVSNFRPTVAKYIYNKFGNNGNIFDPCCGWGGRLFGFLSSNCKSYYGCDPSIETVKGLNNIKNIYSYTDKEINVENCGIEDYNIKENFFDLVFTSPPYFNTEIYSEEDTQSCNKFPVYENWLNGFLKELIHKSYIGLKEDKYFILNISNVKTAPTLEDDFVLLAVKEGFKHIDTMKLELSSIAGNGIKYEPIFVFKK